MKQRAAHGRAHGRVFACFPGPVRRGVVQAQQERRAFAGHAVYPVGGALRQQVGQIAAVLDFALAFEQVRHAVGAAVAEVVDAARHRSVEHVVARAQRAEMRRIAQVPLADQCRAPARLLQQRRHAGMLWRQAQHGTVARTAADGLVGRAAQAILVAPGHQREARGRAHGRVRIALREPQALGREPVDHGRDGAEVRGPAAIAAQIGIAQIVGDDEHDVWRLVHAQLSVLRWPGAIPMRAMGCRRISHLCARLRRGKTVHLINQTQGLPHAFTVPLAKPPVAR